MEKALILSGGGARGAFQVGVIKYLREIGWTPDLICGTSIGAVNAAALGSGLGIPEMERLWQTCEREQIFRMTPATLLRSLRSRRKFSPMSDSRPLRDLLARHIDFARLNACPTRILVSALNMITGQILYFHQKVITIDHLLAASAIPGLFGWSYIDGVPYWDAGVMVNTPIEPALRMDAREIIVVLHSPVGAFPVDEPRTFLKVAELVFEHFLIGSCTSAIPDGSWQTIDRDGAHVSAPPGALQAKICPNGSRILTVAPTRMLGFPSFLNFSARQASALMSAGYDCARIQLKPHLKKP